MIWVGRKGINISYYILIHITGIKKPKSNQSLIVSFTNLFSVDQGTGVAVEAMGAVAKERPKKHHIQL
jgi:hypothetical protein